MKKIFESKKAIFLMTFIHLICAVAYRLFAVSYDEYPSGYQIPVYDSFYSFTMEKIVYDTLSVLVGSLIIYLFWSLVFDIIKNKRISNLIITLISLCIAMLCFPANWILEPDNLSLYSVAVRGIPEYWQNLFTGVFYRACMLLYPDPVVITMIMTMMMLGSIYYLSTVLRKSGRSKLQFLPFIVLLFSDTYKIILNPYRVCIFVCLLVVFVTFILSDLILQQTRSAKYYLAMAIAMGFFISYRNESIIIAAIWLFILFRFYKLHAKKTAIYLGIMMLSFVLFSIPQKMGDNKYYGEDYTIINMMNGVGEIVRNPQSDLTYDGAQSDLSRIYQLVPEDYMKYGLNGYRGYNYSYKNTINQSYLTVDSQNKVIYAMRNLIIHNIGIYLRYQWDWYCEANGKTTDLFTEIVAEYNTLRNDLLPQWEYGYYEVYSDSRLCFNYRNAERIVSFIREIVEKLENSEFLFWERNVLFIVCFIMAIVCDYKNKRFFFSPVIGLLLLQIVLIVVVMPEGRDVYFYPPMYIMILFMIAMVDSIMRKIEARIHD